MDKKVTLNLNGIDIAEVLTSPSKRGFIQKYQTLLAGIMIATAIGFHAWWVGQIGKPLTFNIPLTIHRHPTEIKPVPVPMPIPALTPPLPQSKIAPPWGNRIIQEITTK